MRRLVKLIFLLVLLLLFASTLGVLGGIVEIPWISQTVTWLINNNSWFIPFLQGVLIFWGVIVVVGLLLVLATSGKRKRLVIKDKKNRIEIPKSTIEQIVENSYSSTVHPMRTKTKIKLKGNKRVDVVLKIDVLNKNAAQKMADAIKETVHADLYDALEPIQNNVSIRLIQKDPSKLSALSKKKYWVV